MTESTLSMDYETIQETVGVYLGYDPDYTNWTDAQVAEVDTYIQSGLRQFYYPARTGGMPAGHTWSFLRPSASTTFVQVTGTVSGTASYSSGTGLSTITTTGTPFDVLAGLRLNSVLAGETFTFDTSDVGYVISSVSASDTILVTGDASAEASGDTFAISRPSSYFLPERIGGIVGEVHYDPTVWRKPVQIVSEGDIRRMLQLSTIRGRPSHLGLTSAQHGDMTYGQLRIMRVYPKPDSDYKISYQAMLIPEKLTTTDKYPAGAMMHGETILNSCLAIAERRSEDEVGIHAAAFERSLQASFEIDRQTTTARHMGYNGDDSDGGGGYFGRDTYVNVNGVRPGI